MDSSVSPKDENWSLRVCHHISNAVHRSSLQIGLGSGEYKWWLYVPDVTARDSNYCRTCPCLFHRMRLKCDGTRAETRFRLSTKRTSPFKSAGASVQSTTGRRAVQISLRGLYCSCKPVFCSHVTLTGYPLHSLVSPSLLLPCVSVCHHISTGLYLLPSQSQSITFK